MVVPALSTLFTSTFAEGIMVFEGDGYLGPIVEAVLIDELDDCVILLIQRVNTS